MTSRPCNPDADTKRLWQMLMPGVAMPSCGTAEDKGDAAGENAKPPSVPPDDAE